MVEEPIAGCGAEIALLLHFGDRTDFPGQDGWHHAMSGGGIIVEVVRVTVEQGPTWRIENDPGMLVGRKVVGDQAQIVQDRSDLQMIPGAFGEGTDEAPGLPVFRNKLDHVYLPPSLNLGSADRK